MTDEEKPTYDEDAARLLAEAAAVEDERAAMLSSVRDFAVNQWAKQFVLMFQLAAEFYPELIITAIDKVIPLARAEARARKAFDLACKSNDLSESNLRGAEDLKIEVKKLKEFYDSLARRADKAETYLTSIGERYGRPPMPS